MLIYYYFIYSEFLQILQSISLKFVIIVFIQRFFYILHSFLKMLFIIKLRLLFLYLYSILWFYIPIYVRVSCIYIKYVEISFHLEFLLSFLFGKLFRLYLIRLLNLLFLMNMMRVTNQYNIILWNNLFSHLKIIRRSTRFSNNLYIVRRYDIFFVLVKIIRRFYSFLICINEIV